MYILKYALFKGSNNFAKILETSYTNKIVTLVAEYKIKYIKKVVNNLDNYGLEDLIRILS